MRKIVQVQRNASSPRSGLVSPTAKFKGAFLPRRTDEPMLQHARSSFYALMQRSDAHLQR